jgi:hypothetical protein
MLDALGRRLRFAPPQPRNGFIRLTPRDILLFQAINRHGPLPVHYLYEFTKDAAKGLVSLKRKVSKLTHGTTGDAPYLYRPEQQWASIDGKFQPNIYDLTPRALVALAERSIRLNQRTDPFIHRLMGACCAASIQLAAERKGLKFADTATIINHAKCPETTKKAANPLAIPAQGRHVVPDNLFVIQGEKPAFYAVEIDRRTESINSDTAKTAYGRKLSGYLDILDNRTYRAHFGIPAFNVLTITTNALHLQHMLDYYHTLGAPQYAKHFLFKSVSYFGPSWHVPPIMYGIFNEPWIAADGSQVQIG